MELIKEALTFDDVLLQQGFPLFFQKILILAQFSLKKLP